MAPTLVPISPVIFVVPVFPKAPVTVNNAKLEAVPKFGICPKLFFGKNSKAITIIIN